MPTFLLYHDAPSDNREALELEADLYMHPTPERVVAGLKAGLFKAVAVAETDDLDDIYRRTQNGVVHVSWSRAEDPIIRALGTGTVISKKTGEHFGYRSSSMGDLLLIDDRLLYVDTFGFTLVDHELDRASIPVIGSNATLGEILDAPRPGV